MYKTTNLLLYKTYLNIIIKNINKNKCEVKNKLLLSESSIK